MTRTPPFQLVAAIAILAGTLPATAEVVITQGRTMPTYTTTLDFDEPGGPTGEVPGDAWTRLGLAAVSATVGDPHVDDWATINRWPWLGSGNTLYGAFGTILDFDGSLTALSCRVWDASVPDIGGGIGVYVYANGIEVASLQFVQAGWANAGEPAFDISATDDGVFDEVHVLTHGFGPGVFIDDISWNAASASTCSGDTNGDGVVNVNDLNNVILDWGADGTAHGGDVTGATPDSPPDGVVDVNDLNTVIVNWGDCPESDSARHASRGIVTRDAMSIPMTSLDSATGFGSSAP